MKRIRIPETDLWISSMGCGCVNAGLKWEGQSADEVFDAFFDLGGNLYDTARVYSDWVPTEIGRSERVLGEWISRSNKRNEIVLATKGGHPDMRAEEIDLHKSRLSREEMEYDLDLSLKALQTDWIDLYFYHRDDCTRTVEELIDTMESFVKAGKIRYYGCSNWTAQRIKEADAYCRKMGYRGFAANQMYYNVGSMHKRPAADDTLVMMDEEMLAYHRENPQNLAMPYMGLCSGAFNKWIALGEAAVKENEYYTKENEKVKTQLMKTAEKYHITITQAVLGFFTCQDFNCVPLYGPRGADSFPEACGTFEIPFEKADYIIK